MPKVYVVLGLGALYFFLVFFNIAAEFLVNTIGFVLPAYYSLQALFTSKTTDDTQVRLSVANGQPHYDVLLTSPPVVDILGRLRLHDGP